MLWMTLIVWYLNNNKHLNSIFESTNGNLPIFHNSNCIGGHTLDRVI